MKREIAAVVLLLLLLGASLANLSYYDHLTDRIEADLYLARISVKSGDYPAAMKAYSRAEQQWLDADGFTHIFIRHPEIDSAADAFFDLKQQLYEKNSEGCEAAFDKLTYHLNCIDEMEHPRLGSIF